MTNIEKARTILSDIQYRISILVDAGADKVTLGLIDRMCYAIHLALSPEESDELPEKPAN